MAMAGIDYPEPIQRLILLLKSLPGLGPRSAERMVTFLLSQGGVRVPPLTEAFSSLARDISACPVCGFFIATDRGCQLCQGAERDVSQLCVVEQAADVLRLERSGEYRGRYHVLGGRLSPLDNVTPEDLRIDELVRRLEADPVCEVILAVGLDVEGEATAAYLADLLSRPGVTVTRLAQGMPVGGALDHVDEVTLAQALRGRRNLR